MDEKCIITIRRSTYSDELNLRNGLASLIIRPS